jgi:hypothetical protein
MEDRTQKKILNIIHEVQEVQEKLQSNAEIDRNSVREGTGQWAHSEVQDDDK